MPLVSDALVLDTGGGSGLRKPEEKPVVGRELLERISSL